MVSQTQWPINGGNYIEDVEVIDYHALWRKAITKDSLVPVQSGISKSFVLDTNNLSNPLFEQLYLKPNDAINYLNQILITDFNVFVNIRFKNFPKKTELQNLRSNYINKFSSIKGIVRSITKVQPWITNAMFKCAVCGNITRQKQTEYKVITPQNCTCGKKKWELVPEKSVSVDYQILILQQNPEGLKGGEIPAEIPVLIKDDLCNTVNPGNRVVINGILKTEHVKELKQKNLFEGNYIEQSEKEFDDIVLTDEDIELIKKTSHDPYLFVNFRKSIASSIYGHDVLKDAVLLQLFGGVRHENKDGTFNRGDIHILIVGDPGVAKSKLLESVVKLCPRAIKASGGSSTKAGLTCTAVQDSSGVWTLEAGAIVLGDKGHLIVDEIDKMRDEDRAGLHEGMEQQMITVAKAGIHTTLQARCSILAAANPKSGRFDAFLDVASQIDMPPTLLSRFDLIFTMTDKPDKIEDERLADFILGRDSVQSQVFTIELVKKYISYSKLNCFPKMTLEAHSILKNYYVNVRNLSAKRVKNVPITPRQLEALIRLSEASARVRLSEFVQAQDAERAVEILDKCLKYLAYDPETGTVDIDKMTNKMGSQSRDLRSTMISHAKEIWDNQTHYFHKGKLIQDLVEKGFDSYKVESMFEAVHREGEFVMATRDQYRLSGIS
ncbi:MAG: minichromosome maintenance protein MCM [Candidatus Bipolaricaulis sp.]|nr:minichromosome maintenance protein MCM [Candidatus Bipolaricaulis sp.]